LASHGTDADSRTLARSEKSSSSSSSSSSSTTMDEVELWRAVVDSWKRFQRGSEKNLMKLDLSGAELRILRALEEKGNLPMNRFSAETLLSQPTITGIIDKLEQRELVARVRSLEDRREVLIAITPKGSEILSQGLDLHKRFVERSLASLDAKEVDTLVTLLKKLADASDVPD
jgi:MarR family 2-MHQ and catechol resistance regulon transcriptional repressor